MAGETAFEVSTMQVVIREQVEIPGPEDIVIDHAADNRRRSEFPEARSVRRRHVTDRAVAGAVSPLRQGGAAARRGSVARRYRRDPLGVERRRRPR